MAEVKERLAIRVVIGMNDSTEPCACYACEEPLAPPIGPLLFVEGSHNIVCGSCAVDYVPGLVIMLGHWWQSATWADGGSVIPSQVASFYAAALDEHLGSKGTKHTGTAIKKSDLH